jgi:hypothetical protein
MRGRYSRKQAHAHVAGGEVGLQVDAGGEEVERACVLPLVEVHEAEVVAHDPLERVEVERALQARDRGDVAGLGRGAEEAHADVVPQLGVVGRLNGGDAVPARKGR